MSDPFLRVIAESINVPEVLRQVEDPGCGGRVFFLGVVRSKNGGETVEAVTYDAVAPLAVKVFQKLAAQARERWGQNLNIAVVHRTGRVNVGEAGVAVAVSAPHRRQAFEACAFLIDRIKVEAPIWKKEHYAGGPSRWLEGHPLVG
ncbi:MAG: hypothetical protein A3G41_07840 [Elusimicrobia bacterium RIFCSPLOWO2_12_FULL_59_9]|nr:MAG: hypothetical protein A3G41_07840 [Elusimicrobia bacterium RIFCSPLOWO2_12_FULL_59_9]